MPRMDKTGPENKGTGTGRRLGRCRSASSEEFVEKLGIGQGKRLKAGGVFTLIKTKSNSI